MCGRDIVPGVLRWGLPTACCACAALLVAGCGEAKRDAGEPKGAFSVEVVRASFPARQAIAHGATLEIAVRNAGRRTIPALAVTVDSFSYQSSYPNLAANLRPVWVIDHGPGPVANPAPEGEEVAAAGGAETAFVNTWTLGALAPGSVRTFAWKVTPVKAGRHTVHYQVAAGLDGRALARAPGGARPAGKFDVRIAPLPRATHVNPETGAIVGGPSPTPAGPIPALP
jgi:hypothetical protein